MMKVRSIPRPMIQRESMRPPDRAGVEAAAMSGGVRLDEVVLLRALVPDDLLLVFIGKGRHVARDGGLLANRRRGDRLLVAADRLDEVLEVIDRSVRFLELLHPV